MRKFFLILVSALLVSSCGRSVLVEETHFFENGRWQRFEPEVFTFDVDNLDDCYHVILSLCYDTNSITALSLPLHITFYADSNERHSVTPNLQLKDKLGRPKGFMVDSYCTVTDTIMKYRFFNHKGTQTFMLKQRTEKYELNGVNSILFKVEKAHVD